MIIMFCHQNEMSYTVCIVQLVLQNACLNWHTHVIGDPPKRKGSVENILLLGAKVLIWISEFWFFRIPVKLIDLHKASFYITHVNNMNSTTTKNVLAVVTSTKYPKISRFIVHPLSSKCMRLNWKPILTTLSPISASPKCRSHLSLHYVMLLQRVFDIPVYSTKSLLAIFIVDSLETHRNKYPQKALRFRGWCLSFPSVLLFPSRPPFSDSSV